jgi:hypothetical protein
METDRFDALTAHLARGLVRRRSLGVLAALGTVATLATEAEAGKKGKKRRKKKTCGGACGTCQVCVKKKCTLVADGVACGSGKCFAGQCLTCSGGRVPVDGLCARPCTEHADCNEADVFCHTDYDDPSSRYCMRGEAFDDACSCRSGLSSECGTGRLCVNYTAPKCLEAA